MTVERYLSLAAEVYMNHVKNSVQNCFFFILYLSYSITYFFKIQTLKNMRPIWKITKLSSFGADISRILR